MDRLNIRKDEDGNYVHTFRNPQGVLIGADWELDKLLAQMREHGVEESGPAAQRMGHGLLTIDRWGHPLFIETKPTPTV